MSHTDHTDVPQARGTGLPVFLIHGNGVDHRSLLGLDPVFEAVGGFERIYLDLPGFGRNAPLAGVGGLGELADWVQALTRGRVGERRFALVGHSMGGLLAQEIADRCPAQLAGMALLAPVVFAARQDRELPPRQILRAAPQLLAELPEEDARSYAEMSVVQSPQNWHAYARYVLPGLRAANLRAMARLARDYVLDPLPVERSETHSFPVVVLCGRKDHVVGYRDAERLRRRYPLAELTVCERAGHNLQVDAPEVVAAVLGGWAATVRAAQDETLSKRGGERPD